MILTLKGVFLVGLGQEMRRSVENEDLGLETASGQYQEIRGTRRARVSIRGSLIRSNSFRYDNDLRPVGLYEKKASKKYFKIRLVP